MTAMSVFSKPASGLNSLCGDDVVELCQLAFSRKSVSIFNVGWQVLQGCTNLPLTSARDASWPHVQVICTVTSRPYGPLVKSCHSNTDTLNQLQHILSCLLKYSHGDRRLAGILNGVVLDLKQWRTRVATGRYR